MAVGLLCGCQGWWFPSLKSLKSLYYTLVLRYGLCTSFNVNRPRPMIYHLQGNNCQPDGFDHLQKKVRDLRYNCAWCRITGQILILKVCHIYSCSVRFLLNPVIPIRIPVIESFTSG